MNLSRRAFTLIEMLAATALAALLMIALLSVIASLGRTRAAMNRADEAQQWHEGVVEMIRLDLVNSTSVTTDRDAITIEGHVLLDASDRSATQRLGMVRYHLRSIGNRTWLVRSQQPRNGGQIARTVTELLCPDVRGISLTVYDRRLHLDRGSASPGAPAIKSMPGTVRLTIQPTDPALKPVDEPLVLR